MVQKGRVESVEILGLEIALDVKEKVYQEKKTAESRIHALDCGPEKGGSGWEANSPSAMQGRVENVKVVGLEIAPDAKEKLCREKTAAESWIYALDRGPDGDRNR